MIISEISLMGWITPISLLPSIMETTAVFSSRLSRNASSRTNPFLSTGKYTTSAPSSISARADSKTDSCSMAETIIFGFPFIPFFLKYFLAAKNAPLIARLFASVAEPVKTICRNPASDGQPSSLATISRALSTAVIASWPKEWRLPALPNFSEKYGNIAPRTFLSTGVEAA